ncbi:MAG: dihydrolipoyl dehydrogenase [Verrucomicrobia bacterium]|nr:dihydrolipoyl dehydrogenase [Verrucomicrobiota bacterium]
MSNSAHANDFDVAVIGGGSAGFAAARAVVNNGLKTAVLEGGREVGGLCILRGCMPTKALLYASEMVHQVRNAHRFGIQANNASFSFPEIMARKRRLINEFAEYRRQQLESGTFELIRGNAQFEDKHHLRLDSGRTISAKYFIICTGSIVAPAPMPQLEEIGYITSDEALSLEQLPKSLVILGGGAIAIEFAQFFARLDVRVTLIQRSPHILKEMDTDAATVIETVFQREKIDLYTDTRLINARRKGGLKAVAFEHNGTEQNVSADEILFALGRIPNVQGLNLGAAGVTVEKGRIVTNSEMQTTAENVFAAGDCTGLHEIVHIAIQQGETAAHNIANAGDPKERKSLDYRLLTNVVFTEPQVAVVGLTEKAAHLRGIDFLAASYPFSDHGKSLIMEALDGFVKLLADPTSGEILGGSAVGPVGGELIHEIIAAMHNRMTVHELAAMPHYHPTLAEIWTYPAEELSERIRTQNGMGKVCS